MQIKNLAGVETKDILNVFNQAFSDYFIPLKLTEEQLTSKMISDKTDLDLSVGVFENEQLIAFMLHGLDTINGQKVVYNGGTGVVPEKRGSGLTRQMYLFSTPILKERGVTKIILEVITQNIQAIKSYEKSGFEMKRLLACFKGRFAPTKSNSNAKIKALKTYPWQVMEAFWDIDPSWQNSKDVMIKSAPDHESLGVYLKNQLVGYVIYNPKNKRIQQIAIHKDYRNIGLATELIAELENKYGKDFSVINVDKRAENVIGFFHSIGFENFIEQLEMELDLDKKTATA